LESNWRAVFLGRRLLDASAVHRRVLGAAAVLRRALLPGILGWRQAGLRPWICQQRLSISGKCPGSPAELQGSNTKWICPQRLPLSGTCPGSPAELLGSNTKWIWSPGWRQSRSSVRKPGTTRRPPLTDRVENRPRGFDHAGDIHFAGVENSAVNDCARYSPDGLLSLVHLGCGHDNVMSACMTTDLYDYFPGHISYSNP